MATPETLVGFHSTQESFCYLRALLDYASNNKRSESSIYGAVSFILTLFCTSASVTASKFSNLYLASFPQRDLKRTKRTREFRAPDFTVLVVQSGIGQPSIKGMITDIGPLIWEVKASPKRLVWFGEGRSQEIDVRDLFMQHFHQITAQAAFAKAKFHQKPIYTLLSIGIWFVLLCFMEDPPSVTWTAGKHGQPRLHPVDYHKFFSYVKVLPAPMFNKDCTAFSPEFLYALQLSTTSTSDMTVTLHPFFRPPEGTAELVAAELKKRWFSAKFEEEARRAEIEGKFALGEEESDERSTRWSTAEETETDPENEKHPAAVPATLDHLSTSPAKTRSMSIALKAHAVAKVSTQARRPNAENTATTSKEVPVVPARSSGNARLIRPRRKAAENTPGYRRDSVGSD